MMQQTQRPYLADHLHIYKAVLCKRTGQLQLLDECKECPHFIKLNFGLEAERDRCAYSYDTGGWGEVEDDG